MSGKMMRVAKSFYSSVSSAVRLKSVCMDGMKLGSGFRRACIISPLLGSLCYGGYCYKVLEAEEVVVIIVPHVQTEQAQGQYRKSAMRINYLRKDDYYMAIAFLSGQRSKDPVTQVGACIVNSEDRVVGIGYNGMPNDCPDYQMPWGKEGREVDKKTFYVCHAEMNAIVNKYQADLKGSKTRMYVSLFPCNECAKIIVQSGIKEVIYYSDKKKDQPEFEASRRLFHQAGVSFRQYQPDNIHIDFSSIEK